MADENTIVPLAYSKQNGKFVPIAGQEFQGELAKPSDAIRVNDEWLPLALEFPSFDIDWWNIEYSDDGTWSIAWKYDFTATDPTILVKINHDDRLPNVTKYYGFTGQGCSIYSETDTTATYKPWSCRAEVTVYTYSADGMSYEELSSPISRWINLCKGIQRAWWPYYWWWFRKNYLDPEWEYVVDYYINAAVSYHYLETHCIKDWGITLELMVDNTPYKADAKLVRGSDCLEHPGYATYSGNTASINIEKQAKYPIYSSILSSKTPKMYITARVKSFVNCIGYGVTGSDIASYAGADLRINITMYARKVNKKTGETKDYSENYITLRPSKNECLEYHAVPGDLSPSYAFAPLDMSPAVADDSADATIYRVVDLVNNSN